MLTALLVGVFSVAGGLARFAVDSAFAARPAASDPARHFPWATLIVNAAGSALLGAALALSHSAGLPHAWETGLATGLAGALTTFSAWTVATIKLLEQHRIPSAIVNVSTNLAVGLAAAALGWNLLN